MNVAPVDEKRRSGWERLPEWLRPLERERSRKETRHLRVPEAAVLIVVGLLLTVATVNDVVLQTRVNHRLSADLLTWRRVTGHYYHNISIEQDLTGHSTRDVLCGNTSPGAPGERFQVCLIITGPVVRGVRAARGGYYLSPYVANLRENRYACFGSAESAQLCGLRNPSGAPDTPLR